MITNRDLDLIAPDPADLFRRGVLTTAAPAGDGDVAADEPDADA